MNLLSIVFAVLAASGAGAGEAPSGSWRVERIDSHCILLGPGPGPKPQLLTIKTTPGSGLLQLAVTDPSWSYREASRAAQMQFVLDPGGPVTGERAIPVRNSAGAGVEISGIDPSFLAAFAEAASIRLEQKGKVLFRAQLSDAPAWVRAFRDCEDDSLRQWGVDVAARTALTRLPKPAGAGAIGWFRWQEFPQEASKPGTSGTTIARIAVDAAGRPASCAVAVSAGHPALDRTTCWSILKRARFEPALDSAGKAIDSEYILRTVWRTP
jgi:TonB family protein